ncbi:MAG: nuclear transport factor 2 family protein [Balneolaceae bacterium]|nr:nuclear transport factor 2 family protein [Balneolaceae bacterium]MBO6545993.1 nuclear transport factor 2 family protein [Balneolaceae bacterium]MBO6647389.1 nuclear transport factor 2 family protein [Balneolaceae bacterium]
MKYTSMALFFFYLLMLSPSISAQNSNTEFDAVVKEYLSLYTRMDFDELREFYTEESVFEDPTTSVFDADGNYQRLKGPDDITAFLVKGFAGMSDICFEIQEEYTSGVVAFQYGILHYSSTIGTTKDGQPFQFDLPLSIVLIIKNGKVIHHQDFADYKTWNQQYVNQLEKSRQ